LRANKKACLAVALIVIVFISIVFDMDSNFANQEMINQNSQTSAFPNVQTYGVGLSGGPVVMDESILASLEGNPASIVNMEINVSKYFVPLGIHLVFLDIGWGENDANTTKTLVAGGYSQLVADWLRVGIMYHINTIFFFKQFGYFFSSPSWDQDFLNQYPQAATVNASGINVPLGSCGAGCPTVSGWTITSPYVYLQMQEDIEQLYKWYGNYSSWIGIGEGATGDRNYYAGNGATIKSQRPWDNGTIYAFANSIFFQRNINASGYYIGTNVLSKVWSMFVQGRPETSYSVGYGFVNEINNPVYSGASWNEYFNVPEGNLTVGFDLKAWIGYSGSPTSPLILTLQANYGGKFQTIATGSLSTSQIPNSGGGGWTSLNFTSVILVPTASYQVVFSSSTPQSNGYYWVASDNLYQFPGGSVLWVQSLTGQKNNITIYPYVTQASNWRAVPGAPFYFEVPNEMTVNTVNWFDSDRSYDPNSANFLLEFASNGTVLASGNMSLAPWRGDSSDHYVNYQMNKVVTLYPNVKYEFYFPSLPSTDNYAGSAGGPVTQDFIADNINPSYLGQSVVPTFQLQLTDANLNSSNVNYATTDLFGSPGYQGNTQTALRFSPSASGTLQEFETEVIHADNIAGAVLNVTLNRDNETCPSGITGACSHPSASKFGGVLAHGSISFSSINSTLKSSCPTVTGYCTWANVTTFTGSTSLTAGTYYWIVLNSTNNYCELLRLNNPWKYLLYDSNTNFTSNWYPPPDGPSEISFQIQTSAGDINNTVIGDYEYEFNTGVAGGIAQSFESSSSFQLEDVLFSQSSGNFRTTLYLETDSGSDSPSGRILAYENASVNDGIGLSTPVNITANTKYWIVMNATCSSSCSIPAKAFVSITRSDASSPVNYGGSSLHYEVWSGTSWQKNQPYGQGDISFVLLGTNSTIHTYNTTSLYNEITTYDDQTGSSGWNPFLNYYETSLMYNLTLFLSGISGRHFVWYTGMTISPGNMNLNYSYILYANSGAGGPIGCSPTNPSCGGSQYFYATELADYATSILGSSYQDNFVQWQSLGNTGDNQGDLTPLDMRNDYLTVLAPTARQNLGFDDWALSASANGITNLTEQQYSRAFGQLLNRMQYDGGWYGTEKNTLNVLWVYSSSNEGIFPMLLEPAVHITITTDSNLTGINLSQYNVVINGSVDLTASAYQRVETFVSNNGGGYIDPAFGVNPNTNNPILGLQTNSTSASTSSTLSILVPNNKITYPYSSISYTPYWLRYKISPMSGYSPTTLVQDSNGNPVITVNNYGSGIGVSIEQPDFSRMSSISWGNSWITLLINAMYYSAHKQSMLPIMWESTYSDSSNAPYQSIDGGSPGAPGVLLWASSNSTTKTPFDIHLNATFYGISTSGWIAINMQNMSVIAKGSGSDIHIQTTVPSFDWEPIYIMNDTLSTTTNLQAVYSTDSIISSTIGSSSASYVLSGVENTSAWLILQATSPIVSVSSNVTGTLTQYTSLASLNATTIGYECSVENTTSSTCITWQFLKQEGWYYDSSNGLLYIHFEGSDPVSLSLVQQTGSSSTDSSTTSSTDSSISSQTLSSTITSGVPTSATKVTTTSESIILSQMSSSTSTNFNQTGANIIALVGTIMSVSSTVLILKRYKRKTH
jgi:hypothetical protein